MTGVSITTATGTMDPTSESSKKPEIETSGSYFGNVSKNSSKVTLHVKACCSRCNEHITSWTIESHENHYQRPAIIHSFVEERTDLSSELFPNSIAFTYLGPQHVALFQKIDEAKKFLQRAEEVDLGSIDWPDPPLNVSKSRQIQPSQEQKKKYRVKLPVQLPPVKEKITFGLVCPKCHFLLASAPSNHSLGLDGQIVLYKPSLKMVTSKTPFEPLPQPSLDSLDRTSIQHPKLHQGIKIIYSFSALDRILAESASSEMSNYIGHDVCRPKYQSSDSIKDLVIMLVAQFWCPFASSALRRIAIYNNRVGDDVNDNDDPDIIHEKNDDTINHDCKKEVTQKTKNAINSSVTNTAAHQPCTFLLLDSFPGLGGVKPTDALPSDLAQDVQSVPVPSFIVWYRGCRVFIESGSSQHFTCVKGMVIGLDMARYIDILVPRLAHEASIAFATAMLGTAATRSLFENDKSVDDLGHENTKSSVPLHDASQAFIKDGVVPLEKRPVLKIVL